MTEWAFQKVGSVGSVQYNFQIMYGERGGYKYVLDLAYSKRGRRREIDRRCSCTEGETCRHEEYLRQVTEGLLHHYFGIPWSKIEAEAPIPMGSSTRFADIGILENEHHEINAQNYHRIVELKKYGRSIEEAKMQLLSYMRNSSASTGLVFNGGEIAEFVKLLDGSIVSSDDPLVSRSFCRHGPNKFVEPRTGMFIGLPTPERKRIAEWSRILYNVIATHPGLDEDCRNYGLGLLRNSQRILTRKRPL